MGLKERLEEDLKRAVRERDELPRSVLRLLRSEMHNEEIARRRPLEEEGIIAVISKQVRERRESIGEFRKGQREDLVQREEQELKVLLSYLPTQLTPEELTSLARSAIQEVGARGPSDRGKVMGRLMPQVRGKAEGATVSDIVSQLLEEL